MIARWWRITERHPRLVDAVLLLLVFTTTAEEYHNSETGWAGAPVVAAAASLSLLWRRSRPGAVAVFTGFCVGLSGPMGYEVIPQLLPPVYVALYELGVRTSSRTARTYYFVTVALIAVGGLPPDDGQLPWTAEAVGPFFWCMLPAVYGAAVRARRAALEAVHARAEDAERTREEEARRRVAEERVRIARELHDVVAHHMALANAQAGTAAHLARTRPEQAERMLAELAGTTASAMRELQATVGLLRRSDDPDDSLEPSPGLDRLDDLVSAFASAGLHVTVSVEGEPRPLSPGVDLAAFRIAQEALTNVAKHSGASTAQVKLAYTPDLLTLTVGDCGGATPRPPAPGGGFGLIGMRERAQSAGGRLHAGPRPEGGFAVAAELPIHP